MNRFFLAWSYSVLLMTGCTSLSKKSSQPSPKTFDIVGTWRLEKFTRTNPDGKIVPWCKGAYGTLIYTADGYVSASINCPENTAKNSPSSLYQDRLFYSGKYKFQDGTAIIHAIQNSSQPELMGKNLLRHVSSISKDELVLTGRAGLTGSPVRVEWKR